MGLVRYLRSKEFLGTLIFLVAVVFLLIFGLGIWLNKHTKHGETITVPDLQKLSLQETEELLKASKLTFVVIDSASFNPQFPPLSVIEQNPLAGDQVKENRKIYLTLNPSDYKKVSVPEVIDMTKRQVVTQLKSAGFQIGKERYIPDLGKDVVRGLEINGKAVVVK